MEFLDNGKILFDLHDLDTMLEGFKASRPRGKAVPSGKRIAKASNTKWESFVKRITRELGSKNQKS